MTRERAITLIKSRCPQNTRKPWGVEYKNACEMAIQALEQEPCEDVISRKYIKQKLNKHKDFHTRFYESSGKDDIDKKLYDATILMIKDIEEDVDSTPLVQPMRKCDGVWDKKKVIDRICKWGMQQERIGRYAITIAELKQTLIDTLCEEFDREDEE